MPKIECRTCYRYKKNECSLEHGDYYSFRQCMLGQRSYYAVAEEGADELSGFEEIETDRIGEGSGENPNSE